MYIPQGRVAPIGATPITMAAYIRVSPTLAAVDWVEATFVAQMIHGDVRRVQQARAKTMCVKA